MTLGKPSSEPPAFSDWRQVTKHGYRCPICRKIIEQLHEAGRTSPDSTLPYNTEFALVE